MAVLVDAKLNRIGDAATTKFKKQQLVNCLAAINVGLRTLCSLTFRLDH